MCRKRYAIGIYRLAGNKSSASARPSGLAPEKDIGDLDFTIRWCAQRAKRHGPACDAFPSKIDGWRDAVWPPVDDAAADDVICHTR